MDATGKQSRQDDERETVPALYADPTLKSMYPSSHGCVCMCCVQAISLEWGHDTEVPVREGNRGAERDK